MLIHFILIPFFEPCAHNITILYVFILFMCGVHVFLLLCDMRPFFWPTDQIFQLVRVFIQRKNNHFFGSFNLPLPSSYPPSWNKNNENWKEMRLNYNKSEDYRDRERESEREREWERERERGRERERERERERKRESEREREREREREI